MTKRCSFLIDWTLKIKLLDDASRSEAEIFTNNFTNFCFRASILRRAICVHMDWEWVGQADGIWHLHEGSVAKASGNERLRHEASVVCRRPIYLRRILAWERAAAVRSPATVRVDDNLPARKARVGGWTAGVELSGGVDDDQRVAQQVIRDHKLYDLFKERLADHCIGYLGAVLRWDKNVVDTKRDQLARVVAILYDNLRLAVRSQPRDLAILSLDGHFFSEFIS